MEYQNNIQSLLDAEMSDYTDGAYADHSSARDQLERFASLVAATAKAEEREACAALAEHFAGDPSDIAEAIRARQSL